MRLSLLLLIGLLATAARAQEPEIDLRGTADRWRWRPLPSPPGLGVALSIDASPRGDGLVLFSKGIARYDGRTWQLLSRDVPDFGIEVYDAAPLADGAAVSAASGVFYVAEGADPVPLVRPGAALFKLLVETPANGLLCVSQKRILRLEPKRALLVCEGPRDPVHALGAGPDGALWCATRSAILRRTGSEWVSAELPGDVARPLEIKRIVPTRNGVCFLRRDAPPLVAAPDGIGTLPLPEGSRSLAVARFHPGPTLATTCERKPVSFAGQRWSRVSNRGCGEAWRTFAWLRGSRLLVLTMRGALFLCDLGSNRWAKVSPLRAGLSTLVNELAPSRRGGLWLSTDTGIARFDGEVFTEVHREAAGTRLAAVTGLCEDERGHLWVGSGNEFTGVLRYDGKRWHRYRDPEIGTWCVHRIRRGLDGDIWFLLLGQLDRFEGEGGVARYRDGVWRRFTTADGLPHDRCYDLHATRAHGVVAATMKGVARLEEGAWRRIGSGRTFAVHVDSRGDLLAGRGLGAPWLGVFSDGAWTETVNGPTGHVGAASFSEGPDGRVWFASRHGVFFRHDGHVHEVSAEPGSYAYPGWPVLAADDGTVWIGTLGQGLLRYRLDDDEPPFTTAVAVRVAEDGTGRASFRGSDPWHVTPEDLLRFRYRIDSGPWSGLATARDAALEPLEPGTHRITVQAVDLAGNFETNPPAREFEVPAPLLANRALWAAAIVAASALACALFLFLRHRRDRVRRAHTAAELKRFRTILDQAGESIFVVDPETERFLDANETAATALGRSREELLRMGPRDIQRKFERPGAWERFRESVRASDAPVVLMGEHERSNGTAFPVEVSILRSEFEDREIFLVVARDITERVRAMQAIRETEARFRFMVENSSELIYLQSVPDGEFLFVSPACESLTGYTPDQFRSVHRSAILWDHPLSRSYARVGTAAVRGELDEIPAYTVALRHRDGRTRIFRVHGNYAEDDGERRLIGIATDITEIHEAEAAVRHAEKLKSLGVLAGGIAHDFNNLLVGVLGNAELARCRLRGDSPVHSFLAEIETASNRAADLCRQLMAYAGKGRFVLEPLDLSAVVEEMIKLLQVSIPKNVTVEVALDRGLPQVEADPAQVRQVVMNLVTNAAEAIGDGIGRIRIATGRTTVAEPDIERCAVGEGMRTGEHVYVEVTDDGCGMDEQTRARIFDPFFTTKFTGRGLGLAVVHGIVRANAGGLAAESELGRGTRFRLLLPTETRVAPVRTA